MLNVKSKTPDQILSTGADGYDYSAINELLSKNAMKTFISGERQELGNVLLAGATGYLGVHVLKELLTTTNANVYCLVRAKENSNGVQRLKYTLNNYFGKNCAELFDSRILLLKAMRLIQMP